MKIDEIAYKWDLGAIFIDEASCINFCDNLELEAKKFNEKYKDKINSLAPKDFKNAILNYEELLEKLFKISTYAFLRFSQNTTDGKLYSDLENRANAIEAKLLFFELEIQKIEEEDFINLIKVVPQFAYYLEKIKKNAKHKLSIKEEEIILALQPVGASAFGRLFDEYLSRLKFKNCTEEDKKHINEEEILSLLHSEDREIRKNASKIFTKKLKQSTHLLAYILNIVRKDLSIDCKLRNYKYKEEFRHIQNDTTKESVDNMLLVVNENIDIVADYYAIKQKIMGHKLKDYDRYAPIFKIDGHLSYEEALQVTINAYENFNQDFAKIIKKALKEGWVDAMPDNNKRGGAFSHSAVPSAHPFVLLNYTNTRRDAFTIAHEFGHMIHQELSKKCGLLNCDAPLTTSETASVFGEMLLFEEMEKLSNDKENIALYASKLEDIFSTLFRQTIMTNFEQRIHNIDDELSVKEFNAIWIEENEKMFKDSVKLTKNYKFWWSYIPHFVHSPFYCYSYAYGQLLVLALYGLYKSSNKEDFVKAYTKFLSSGGSKSPRDLVLEFGFDVNQKEFWEIGIKEIRNLYKKFIEKIEKSNVL